MSRILITDHDPETMLIFAETLRERGHDVILTKSGEEAMGVLRNRGAEIFLLDMDLPITDGFVLMGLVFRESLKTTVVGVVGPGEFGKGKRAMAEGAFHFLCRPLVLTELSQIIDKAAAVEVMKRRLGRLGIVFLHDYHRIGDLGAGIRLWSGLDTNAMVLCDIGGGGAELAELLHFSGPRKSRPFVRVDCRRGAVAFDRELYGFSRGAFLGADGDRIGLVEESRGGTLNFDHFEAIDPTAFEGLSKLVLESRFTRVGEEAARTANVRIVCCASLDFPESRKGVPQRLFNALGAMKITIPRLKDCRDLSGVAADLMMNRVFHGSNSARTLSAADVDIIRNHPWTGNLRELDLTLELWNLVGEWRLGRTVGVTAERPGAIEVAQTMKPAPAQLAAGNRSDPEAEAVMGTVEISESMDYGTARDIFEAAFIDFKLRQFGGNVTTTARKVGLGRRTLQEKMKKVGIDSQKYREE